MQDIPAATSTRAAGAWWRAALVLAWLAGVAVQLQLQQPALWPRPAYLLLAAGLAAALAGGRLRRATVAASRALALLAALAIGFGVTGWRADIRLADALAPEWEGCDVELVGVVGEMPQLDEDGEHFAFVVESARALAMTPQQVRRLVGLAMAAGAPTPAAAGGPVLGLRAADTRTRSAVDGAGPDVEGTADGRGSARLAGVAEALPLDGADAADAPPAPSAGAAPRVPSRVWLAWGRNQCDDRAIAAAPPPLRAGQRWRLAVRLRQPHGAMNPDGFDAELWLFDQDLRVTGAVRGNGELLATGWAPIENARQWVRDRLLLSGSGSPANAQAAGALAALAVDGWRSTNKFYAGLTYGTHIIKTVNRQLVLRSATAG